MKRLSEAVALQAERTFDALLAGWRDPTLRRANTAGRVVQETGLPLRAIVGYLFAEVAKNCYLLHHPDQWIEFVSRSQWGDRCFDIAPERLPSHAAMEADLEWEKGVAGPELMLLWLTRFAATPFDYNRGLDDESLSDPDHAPPLHLAEGTNFFRGLALIDLAEAMLKRAFSNDHLAVRVNRAGQGDYFQVTNMLRPLECGDWSPLSFSRLSRACDASLPGLPPQQERKAMTSHRSPKTRKESDDKSSQSKGKKGKR